MRFRFVHAADLHLDSPFKGICAESALLATFQEATFRAFSRIVDLCLREHVAFLLLAGDLFDVKDRSVRARLALRRELERLHAAGRLDWSRAALDSASVPAKRGARRPGRTRPIGASRAPSATSSWTRAARRSASR